jgi:hypothetical protein
MGNDSAAWDELPEAVRDAIVAHAGHVSGAKVSGDGNNSNLRVIIDTADGQVFLKGIAPGGRGGWKLDQAAALAPYVSAISPPLLWRVQAEGWDITAWPALPGRPWADQTPGSPDLPKMLAVLRTVGEMRAPGCVATTAAQYWGRYTSEVAALDGDMLVHQDMNLCNFVVNDERAWLVDWGWAVRGPAWLTVAEFVLALLESDWEPGDAERFVKALPAWRAADPRHIDVFARANVAMWDEVLREMPGWPLDWRAGKAREWAEHRARRGRGVTSG